ncbi:MAG: hypothetical protein GY862_02230 [Gammaproteobacteria bacterium]|nr:hypothetical protein [Gammaproteobacteria bacterium]
MRGKFRAKNELAVRCARRANAPYPADFRRRIRPVANRLHREQMEAMLAACCVSRFHTVWMNYSLSSPQTTAVELDVFARGSDADSSWALAFEIKNRDEKHMPAMTEAQDFVSKIEKARQAETGKNIAFICPVYLSAKGFGASVEAWLHEQGVLTADLESWEGRGMPD